MQSIIRSRDSWKQKAISRRQSVRNQERKLLRLSQRHQLTLQQLQSAENACEDLRESLRIKSLTLSCPGAMESTVTSVLLIIQARISFRAAPRVLMAMGFRGWVPHFSSIINWVCRVGLSCLKHVKSPTEDWIAIIDMSIDIAYKKALVILRLPLSVYVQRGGAVTLEDVSCAGVLVRASWKSEGVADALQEVLGHDPHLRGILKDSGSDLQKGVRLWKEANQRPDVFVISDIGHEAANALKADFKDRESFKSLTRKLKNNATKIYQSRVAFLAPPKLRPKGRFMGISRLGKWMERIQKLLGDRGRVPQGSLASEIRRLFGGLGSLGYIAGQLCERSLAMAEIMDTLKTKGLNRSSYLEAKEIVDKFPKKSQSYKRISKWLTRHIHVQCRLGIGQTPLPVSSDIIESLFGTFKNLIARNSKAEMNHLILAMPALCGKQTVESVSLHLNRVSHTDFIAWKNQVVGVTSKMKRRKCFSGNLSSIEISNMGQARPG